MLCQLQRLFAYLQESEKRFANTRPFCESYKELDGSPVNPNVQMDVDGNHNINNNNHNNVFIYLFVF